MTKTKTEYPTALTFVQAFPVLKKIMDVLHEEALPIKTVILPPSQAVEMGNQNLTSEKRV
jgi:hypothetical protein